MLAVFYGTDRVKAGKAASDFISKQKAEEAINFDEISANAGTILSYAEQGSLFGGRKVVKCDGVFEKEEVLERVVKNLEAFEKSPNIFVFIESSLDSDLKKKFSKWAETMEEFKAPKKREAFNIFSLSDALGRRDKKTLWVLLTRALRAGKTPEEISGTLFWQLKVLSILKEGGGETLSPFVVMKSKSHLNNWKREELLHFSYKLVDSYHKAHRGRGDLETALERFALSI